MDLQALMMGSESLLTHIARPDGIPRLDKSLAEIERGSLRMGAEAAARSRREAVSLGVTAEVAEQKQELKGGSMLARNRFDPESLTRAVNAVHLRGGYQPLQPLGETDIEGYLAHHHDMIVLTAVHGTRAAAEECSLVRQREWEVDSWRETKKALMGEAMNGGVSSCGGVGPSSFSGVSMLRGPSGVGGAGEQGRVHPETPRPEGSLAVVAVPPAGGVIPPVSAVPPTTTDTASRLSALEVGHLAVIRALNDTDGKFPLATRLAASASTVVTPGVKNGPEHAYFNALKMLETMLEGEGWEGAGASTSRSRLDGTLDFLQKQFKQVIDDQVKRAREAGTVDASTVRDTDTGLPFKVRAFMRLDRKSKFVVGGGAMLSQLPVWPQIFLCLRCGGRADASAIARAAAESPENSRCTPQELELLTKVSELLAQGKTENAFGGAIQQAFHSMRDGEDSFKQSVLNILSASDDKKVTRINKETIEDYMWFKLSFVGSDVESSEILESAKARVSGRDARRRFDPDGTNTYAYVNVLLYTQQLEAAVAFLHWKGQHLAALHMALAMSHHNAYTAGERTSGTPHDHNHYPGDGGEPGPAPTLVDLMARVVEGRIDSDPQMCVEYMLRLPVPVAVECIGALCVEMGAEKAARFLGYIQTDGNRKRGDLDRFLTEDTVEDVAFNAAQKAEDAGRKEDAMTFFGLSCDWEKMAGLLQEKLAENLDPQAEKRAFWKELGTTIYTLLNTLSQGPDSSESRALATKGVGQMLRLMDFYVFLSNRELFKALIELEGAGMLPSSQEEAAGLADTIRRRGPQDTVTAVLPHALENGMQCVRHHHLEVKRELHGGGTGGRIDGQQWIASREKRLAELEAKGRAMVGFAGRLSDMLPASFVADLSRVEANIIN
ncbi:Nuclear pore complex protein Nup93, putative [Ectocarpus siliculosus]|uniref:Nuclear pore protein n=1 Tax=Ectocarpus siliculosus TaxID=2880 RepID=D7G7G5_ECTSI|nr:Nuclear pore complex protein Nup93, putative [Ectocarpus siliculosus]|eukprot:CBJ27707.1 Nuclear pore complex protein Nup93, putative [Ectocarpus siliculosus]